MRHEQRARDRRRRHDQHAGAALAALGLQGQALVHAEAVLLVDDGEGQVLERDIRLEQGVRADQDVDVAGREPLQQLGARAALLAPREQRHAQAGGIGERRDGLGVLARQHLGRRHQRGLRAGLHGDGHGHQRHHGLAGADVALQQAQHAVRGAHVLGDLLQRLALRVGEAEGQRVGDPGADAAVAGDAAARLRLEALAHQRQRQLARQQLVVGQALPGREAGDTSGGSAGRCRRASAPRASGQPRCLSQAALPFGQLGHALDGLPAALSSTLPERPAVSG